MKKNLLLALLFPALAQAQNPYMPLWEFIPDGEPYVFEDPDNPGHQRVYVYGSHDVLEQYYCGKDQVVWSAPVEDLTNWRYDGVIFELKKDAKGNLLNEDGSGDVLYAPDVLETRDASGKKVYYLYPNVQSQERASAVAKSSRPDGPFQVCNWDPQDPRKTVGPLNFDPAAFVDTDGRAYAYWGFGRSGGAELDTSTMATVKPGTQVQRMLPGFEEDQTFRFYEASSIRKIQDKYVLLYSRMTAEGEDGLPASNYTLAYAYGNTPLGPWTYGGTIIDGRGKKRLSDGTVIPTATPNGNTHGSICEINGQWYVFYHRQAGTNEYSRQAMVAPITVTVVPGETGFVRISEAEFTSEGFQTQGLDPLRTYAAGIACYFTGPEPAHQEYPNVVYPGSHTQIYRHQYDGRQTVYDREINRCSMVNNVSGSTVGYKYFNLQKTYGQDGLKLALTYIPEGTAGEIEVWLDQPTAAEGGERLATFSVPAETSAQPKTAQIPVPGLKAFNGKHALYLVFHSPTAGQSICTLEEIGFTR